jgi:hypothetical protein
MPLPPPLAELVGDGVGSAAGVGAVGVCWGADVLPLARAGDRAATGIADGCGCPIAGADGVTRPRAGNGPAVDPD